MNAVKHTHYLVKVQMVNPLNPRERETHWAAGLNGETTVMQKSKAGKYASFEHADDIADRLYEEFDAEYTVKIVAVTRTRAA